MLRDYLQTAQDELEVSFLIISQLLSIRSLSDIISHNDGFMVAVVILHSIVRYMCMCVCPRSTAPSLCRSVAVVASDR